MSNSFPWPDGMIDTEMDPISNWTFLTGGTGNLYTNIYITFDFGAIFYHDLIYLNLGWDILVNITWSA